MFDKNKAKLSEENFKLLMTEVNQIIEYVANQRAESITSGKITTELSYPPNGGFIGVEKEKINLFIEQNKGNIVILRKLLADTAAFALFNLFNLFDGTGSPTSGNWKNDGITLVDMDNKSEQYFEVLHDGMYDGYWNWRNIRNKEWRLDNLKD